MKLSKLLEELEWIKKTHGDIPVQLQSDPGTDGMGIVDDEHFFVVVEEYDEADGGNTVNIRAWPY